MCEFDSRVSKYNRGSFGGINICRTGKNVGNSWVIRLLSKSALGTIYKVIPYKDFHKNNKNKSMCMNTYIKRVLTLIKFAFIMSIISLTYARKHIITLNFKG